MKTNGCDTYGYLLHSEADLLAAAQVAIAYAQSIGAQAASAQVMESAGTTIKVRGGEPVTLVRDGVYGLSITIFDRGRSGHAHTQAGDLETVQRTVDQACAIARQVEADTDSGLAAPSWYSPDAPKVPLFAPSAKTPGELTAIALEIEAAALEVPAASGIDLRVGEAVASSMDIVWARVMSNGFARSASASLQTRACVCIAEQDGAMGRDWWQAVERRDCDLPDHEVIAGEAAKRAMAKLGARSLATQSAPILFEARVAASLLFDLVGALSGAAQQQRSTFLLNSIGSQRLAADIDLREDPFVPFGLASARWDSEGVSASPRYVVRGGTIEGYFLNVRMARKLAMPPTGNADGPANLILTSRNGRAGDDITQMLRKMHRGLWVTQIIGGQVNLATGDYSKAVEGFWVENGEAVYPVRDLTIAGKMPEMLANITAVGGDHYRQGAVRTGSILIDAMRIAGQ
jgi:PmbA protein